MNKHTPGPWYSASDSVGRHWVSQQPEGGTFWIAEALTGCMGDETEANARLIAAAPDLLEACKDVLAEMRAYNAESEFDESCPMKPTFDQLKAAIAKAEGKEAKDV